MDRVPFGSTVKLTATLTDSNGAGVEGATVTLTVTDRTGSDVVDAESMTEEGDGVYTYLASPEELARREHLYRTKVTAVAGALDRYLEGLLFTAVDTS